MLFCYSVASIIIVVCVGGCCTYMCVFLRSKTPICLGILVLLYTFSL